MKNTIWIVLLFLTLFSCSKKDLYNPSTYYTDAQQTKILAGIITHIFSAPVYSRMEDRFQEKHKSYYVSLTTKFQLVYYFISTDSTHYFYVIRPSSIASEQRAVGGHFKLKGNGQLIDFREEFVTTVMPADELKNKAGFLFDEMVKGNLSKYLQMKHYIQWPNEASYYDTITYEWKIKPELKNEY